MAFVMRFAYPKTGHHSELAACAIQTSRDRTHRVTCYSGVVDKRTRNIPQSRFDQAASSSFEELAAQQVSPRLKILNVCWEIRLPKMNLRKSFLPCCANGVGK